ncbi:Hpt domain-containing protein [Halorubellus sp. PRR65]|uniref:Hpt domain-containing protein n=1 Tax=Halorubellus sp. PRR65 TaxID=3098148 RepID=UPI002B25EFA7|nr:Hpt domain-containing protein [Halorubellus sp. PRR65]
MDEYVRDFVQEGEENVTELNNALLELEHEPGDEEAMDRIFRMAHTLKGNAGAMGFEEASDLAHAIEDLLDAVRAGQMAVSADLMDDVFDAVDEFETMLDDVREHGEIRTDPSDTIDRLRAVEAAATGAPGITDPSEDDLEDAVRGLDDLDEPDHTVYHVRLAVVQEEGVNNAALVVDALEDAFDLLGTTPSRDVVEADDASGRIDAVFGSAVTPGAIEAALEPVEAVDDWIITDVTSRYAEAESVTDESADAAAASAEPLPDDPAAEIDEDVAQDMSVDELLGEFNEYDDLDALVEEMDDVSGFDDLGEAGSFDDLDLGEDLEPDDEPADDPLGGDDLAGDDDLDLGGDDLAGDDELDLGGDDLTGDDDLDLGGDDETTADAGDADDPEQVEDAAETFAELKQEVDPVGFDELQDELDELEFDEYSDEEEVGFDELLGDDFEEGDDDFFGDDVDIDDGDVDDILVDDVTGFDEADAEADSVEADAETDSVEADAEADSVEADSIPADVSTEDVDAGETAVDAATAADEAAAVGDALDDAQTADATVDADASETTDADAPETADTAADAGAPETADATVDDGFDEAATAEDGFDSAPDVGGFDEPTTVDAGGDDEFGLESADPDGDTSFDDVDDPFEGTETPASADADAGFGEDFESEGIDSDFDTDDSFAADTDDSFDVESGDGFETDADLDFGEDDAPDVDAETEASSTAGPLADVDEADLDSVEVGEFELDEPEAETTTADSDVQTGDFGTDAGFGDDAASSGVEYDGVDAGGFDDAPEDAADVDAPDGEMDPDEARALVDATLPSSGDETGDSDVQSVRVDVDQVDRLLNLVEGLVTNRVRLRRAVEEDAGPAQLDDDLDELEDITGELQDTVMDIRLVPLKMTANKLPRVVRDVSREQGKDVDFEMDGEDVEMDRTILDEISDPLVHLVRNAVDHGIESREEREGLDKPDTGTVTLEARRARDRVVVEVTDDGRGLDPDVLRDEAVEEDILSREEADALSDNDARELVFHPGLSTAAEVTDVSGRGVGMDVVRSTVEDLDGEVEIESELGAGTTIRLVLPVSVAIDDVLFVECGDEEFGIPTKVVRDIGSAAAVEQGDDREVVRTDDGDETPLVRLGDALGSPGSARADGGGMLLHVRGDVRDVALHCDRVQGQQEVVVKPYDDVLGGIPGLSGATVLGEGEVVNILDVKTL